MDLHGFVSKGIDDEYIINLDHVRKIGPGYMAGEQSGCDTIKLWFSNGDYTSLRYGTKRERNADLKRLNALFLE
jgi:hypothetical protein